MTNTAAPLAVLAALVATSATAMDPPTSPGADPSAHMVVRDLTVVGELSRERFSEAAQPALRAIEACYLTAVAEPGLAALGGQWTARVVLHDKGGVESAVATRSTVHHAALEACALGALGGVHVKGKKTVGSVQLTVAFVPAKGAVAEPMDPEGSAARLMVAEPTVLGLRPPDEIRQVVLAGEARIRGCHTAGLQRASDLSGSLYVRYNVPASGQPEDVVIARSSLHDDTTERCVVGVLQGLRFPPRDDRALTIVRQNLDLALAHQAAP